MIRGLVWWRVMAIPFLQFSSKKQASDWCHGGVVIVYVYLLWGQPARGLRFWGILGYNGIASTLNLPSHQNFSVWSSLVKPLRSTPCMQMHCHFGGSRKEGRRSHEIGCTFAAASSTHFGEASEREAEPPGRLQIGFLHEETRGA